MFVEELRVLVARLRCKCHDCLNPHDHGFHIEFIYNHYSTRSLVVGLPLTWTMSSISLAPGLTIVLKAKGKGFLKIKKVWTNWPWAW